MYPALIYDRRSSDSTLMNRFSRLLPIATAFAGLLIATPAAAAACDNFEVLGVARAAINVLAKYKTSVVEPWQNQREII